MPSNLVDRDGDRAAPMEGGPTAVDTGIVISTSDIEADHSALPGSTSTRRSPAGARRFRRCSGFVTRPETR